MTYEPEAYWLERGRHYEDTFPSGEAFDTQEQALTHVLERLHKDREPKSILEVGCGFGRIGARLLNQFPQASYTGVDISPHQIRNARKRLPENATLITSSIQNLQLGDLLFDLIVAVEVFMHIPPDEIQKVVGKLLKHGPVLSVDWTEPIDGRPSAHNFIHDYEELSLVPQLRIGKQTIFYAD